MALAERIGSAKAAEQLGLKPATVRSWKRRLKEGLASGAASVPQEAPPAPVAEAKPELTKAARLRARAEELRRLNADALDMAARLIGSKQAAEARNAATVATAFGTEAERVEAAAREAEQAEEATALAEAKAIEGVFRMMGAALGFPPDLWAPPVSAAPSACSRLLDAILGAPIKGNGRIEVPEALCRAARMEVDHQLRADVEAELRPKLPASTPPREPEPMVAPRRVVQAVPVAPPPPAPLPQRVPGVDRRGDDLGLTPGGNRHPMGGGSDSRFGSGF